MNPFAPLIGSELETVEKVLHETLTGSALEDQVNRLCLSMVDAGGKRIRPVTVLLCAHLLPDYQHETDLNKTLWLASAVELLHTATLIHDDVIDNSTLRRGVRTINDTSGNHIAVLAGDYLFTRCFNLLRKLQSLDAMGEVSNTIATLVSGELMQLEKQSCLDLSEEDYRYTIYAKTGALFELSASALAVVNHADDKYIQALKAYGRAIGSAFQIADDNLDYAADSEVLGKKAGIDLMDGRITLPVILALKHTEDEKEKEALKNAVMAGDFNAVKAAIDKCNALTLSHNQAQAEVDKAVEALTVFEDSEYKRALIELAKLTLSRKN